MKVDFPSLSNGNECDKYSILLLIQDHHGVKGVLQITKV
jgi:hypothetical protein